MATEDLLTDYLVSDEVRIRVQDVFQIVRGSAPNRVDLLQRSKTLGDTKSLVQFFDLVRQAIENSERDVPQELKVIFTEEQPDVDMKDETISLRLISRKPGAFQRGSPGEAKIRNMQPRLREENEDTDHPGYKIAVTGYWYDSVIRFTCLSTSNKRANARAVWFEDLMEEYSWWFKLQGVDRTIFRERHADTMTEIGGKRWYGRPIDYFVRTEKLRQFSEKKIEEIIIKRMVKQE